MEPRPLLAKGHAKLRWKDGSTTETATRYSLLWSHHWYQATPLMGLIRLRMKANHWLYQSFYHDIPTPRPLRCPDVQREPDVPIPGLKIMTCVKHLNINLKMLVVYWTLLLNTWALICTCSLFFGPCYFCLCYVCKGKGCDMTSLMWDHNGVISQSCDEDKHGLQRLEERATILALKFCCLFKPKAVIYCLHNSSKTCTLEAETSVSGLTYCKILIALTKKYTFWGVTFFFK